MTVSAADSQKQRGQTSYRVLRLPEKPTTDAVSASGGIKDYGFVKAATSTAAKKATAQKEGQGVYVAVPQSSWKPQKVTVQQTVTVKVGDA